MCLNYFLRFLSWGGCSRLRPAGQRHQGLKAWDCPWILSRERIHVRILGYNSCEGKDPDAMYMNLPPWALGNHWRMLMREGVSVFGSGSWWIGGSEAEGQASSLLYTSLSRWDLFPSFCYLTHLPCQEESIIWQLAAQALEVDPLGSNPGLVALPVSQWAQLALVFSSAPWELLYLSQVSSHGIWWCHGLSSWLKI